MVLLAALVVVNVGAGDTVLSNNSGEGSTVWFIRDEPSLVINGFDLTPLGLTFPVQLDAITISVAQGVPGAPVEAVVYEDPNGGSPIDARLVARRSLSIDGPGVARVVFDPPVTINAPVIWVGFYLPVDTRFYADRSGSSVLTYWGWTPGSTFDLANLATAAVLGPADGTAPVNLNMGGIARINAELITGRPPSGPSTAADGTPLGVQLTADGADLSVLENYEYCGPVFYDREDKEISARDSFRLYCRVLNELLQPAFISPNTNYERRGFLFDITAFGNYQRSPSDSERLVVPVTHCLRPNPDDLENAVLGIAYGSPRTWHILPTIRVGDLICAEMTHTGNIAYFVPRDASTPTRNLNLTFGSQVVVTPQPLICNQPSSLRIPIYNTGFEPTGSGVVVSITDTLVRTGEVLKTMTLSTPPLEPGQTYVLNTNFVIGVWVGELHTLTVTIDPGNQISELNENDNLFSTSYILQPCS